MQDTNQQKASNKLLLLCLLILCRLQLWHDDIRRIGECAEGMGKEALGRGGGAGGGGGGGGESLEGGGGRRGGVRSRDVDAGGVERSSCRLWLL